LAPVPFAGASASDSDEASTQHIREATVYGPSCIQPAGTNPPSIYEAYMPEFLPSNPTFQSEDCLFLNVYAPKDATADAKLPVLVFIPGGAFSGGSGNVPYTIPDQWIERKQEMVIITIK
jgi:carboxylesterase type B